MGVVRARQHGRAARLRPRPRHHDRARAVRGPAAPGRRAAGVPAASLAPATLARRRRTRHPCRPAASTTTRSAGCERSLSRRPGRPGRDRRGRLVRVDEQVQVAGGRPAVGAASRGVRRAPAPRRTSTRSARYAHRAPSTRSAPAPRRRRRRAATCGSTASTASNHASGTTSATSSRGHQRVHRGSRPSAPASEPGGTGSRRRQPGHARSRRQRRVHEDHRRVGRGAHRRSEVAGVAVRHQHDVAEPGGQRSPGGRAVAGDRRAGRGRHRRVYPRDDSAAATGSYGAGPRNGLGRTSRWGGTVDVRRGRQRFLTISRISSAVSDGVLPTLTPTASRASFLACAVPEEPDTMAPAWPMVLPSGAVKPAT